MASKLGKVIDKLTGVTAINAIRVLVVSVILTVAVAIPVAAYYKAAPWIAKQEAKSISVKGKAAAESTTWQCVNEG